MLLTGPSRTTPVSAVWPTPSSGSSVSGACESDPGDKERLTGQERAENQEQQVRHGASGRRPCAQACPYPLTPGSCLRRNPCPLNLCYRHDVITHGLLVTVPATDSDPTAGSHPTVLRTGFHPQLILAHKGCLVRNRRLGPERNSTKLRVDGSHSLLGAVQGDPRDTA